MNTKTKPTLRVGIAGLGAVGLEVARRLIDGIPGLTLTAVAVRDADKARRALPQIGDMIALRTATDLGLRLRRGGGVPAAGAVPRRRHLGHRQGPAVHAAVGRAIAGERRPDRARQGKRRAHPGADRRADRPRRRARRRRRHHPFGEDGDAQAAGRARGRALFARARHFGDRPDGAAESVRRHGARGRARLSDQCERGGGVQPGRHRAGPHATGNLGRSGR